MLALTTCKRRIWIFPPFSADVMKWIHAGLQLLLYVQLENFRIFFKQKVTREKKSHCTLSEWTVAVNSGKIQIQSLRGVKANKICLSQSLNCTAKSRNVTNFLNSVGSKMVAKKCYQIYFSEFLNEQFSTFKYENCHFQLKT